MKDVNIKYNNRNSNRLLKNVIIISNTIPLSNCHTLDFLATFKK